MFQNEYKAAFSKVTASQQTRERIMNMAKKKSHRNTGFIGKALIAAALISLLAVTVSAAESSWFARFFGSKTALSQEQIQFLEEKTQKIEVEPTFHREPKQDGHQDILQFVKDTTIISADQNNTDMTGEGQPSYHDIKLDSLTLSETEAKLYYYYFEDMDTSSPCSMPHITVVMASGEEVVMPLTASTRTMTFTAETPIDLYRVVCVRLADGTELTPVNAVDDGFELSIDSVMTDGNTAYVTLNVTIPENIPTPGEGWVQEGPPHFSGASSWYMPASQEKITPEQLVQNRLGGQFIDDGDGVDTTSKIIVTMSTWDAKENQFVSGSKWKLHIGGFQCTFHNPDNQKAVDEKYAGQDYIIEGEEAAQVVDFRDVCWDTWDFEFTIEGEETAIEEIEFITEPVALSGRRATTINEILSGVEDDYLSMDAELISFRISPLSYYIEYASDDPTLTGTFDPGMFTLVMHDGTEIELYPYNGRENFQQPIILANVDCLILPNGEKMPVPN